MQPTTLKPVFSEAAWTEWEAAAKPPLVYDPPQKAWSSKLWITRCECCGCLKCVRSLVCNTCCGTQSFRISEPDEWFRSMLAVQHPNCPERFRGLFWFEDNVAAETVVTVQDASWETPRIALKSARNNWSLEANSAGGVWLSGYFAVTGGNHQLEVSPNGRWVHIKVISAGSHWLYVPQPGDVFKRPDGSVVDLDPTQDMIRVSYAQQDTSSQVTYQYLFRRVAYLDARGGLVKTKAYSKLAGIAASADTSALDYKSNDQAVHFAPPLPAGSPAQVAMH